MLFIVISLVLILKEALLLNPKLTESAWLTS